jgi:GNAT superfamily N-acetyltransferase
MEKQFGQFKLIASYWGDNPIPVDPKRHDFRIDAVLGKQEVGYALISHEGNAIRAAEVDVSKSYRRKGIATAMYDWAEELTGKKIRPSTDFTGETFEEGLSEDAQKFWNARWRLKKKVHAKYRLRKEHHE